MAAAFICPACRRRCWCIYEFRACSDCIGDPLRYYSYRWWVWM